MERSQGCPMFSAVDTQEGSNGPSKAQDSSSHGAKSFVCTNPGCNKSFTRAEHLQRHALNHTPGGLACAVCSANFKRPDLLKRHMDRHRQKDLEAGGPGCGTLDTRKRAWRAADGNVVSKRPCANPPAQSKNHFQTQGEAQQQPSPEPEDEVNNALLPPNIVAQPYDLDYTGSKAYEIPTRTLEIQLDNRSPEEYRFEASLTSNSAPTLLSYPDNGRGQNLSQSSAYDDLWDGQSQPTNFLDSAIYEDQLDYDQIFQPDTASSFNMPFTTAIDYDWLFQAKPKIYEPNLPRHPSLYSLGERATGFAPGQSGLSPDSITTGSSRLWSEPSDNISHQQDMSQSRPEDPESINAIHLSQHSLRLEHTTSPQAYHSTRRESTLSTGSKAHRNHQITSHAVHTPELERPFSMLNRDTSLPKLDGIVRERLLDLIESAHPSLPDSNVPLRDDPLLSTSSLQSYLDLYFTRFNTTYPLLHLPTFQTNNSEPLLLLSVLLLGATYSSKDAHQLAVCIHDVIRPSIFSHAGFSHQPQLWTLQTILLVECFGKSRAGQKQHDMSHLFHGLLINLIRRSDCQSVKPTGPPTDSVGSPAQSLQCSWNNWAVAEQKKRLALLCFMWDTQHAVIFCQSLCMSAFELRIDMPCSQNIWEAADAASWQSAWQTTSSTSHNVPFLIALKSYLTPSIPRPLSLSLLARVLILHGIMATFWDMQRRDQTSLGALSNEAEDTGKSWRILIGEAYDAWASDFSSYCEVFASPSQNSKQAFGEAISQEFTSFAAAYKALYHSAQIILNADLLDVQIYAGARHILGRPVRQKDYLRSAEVVKRWAASDRVNDEPPQTPTVAHQIPRNTTSNGQSARLAAWHAARLLQESKDCLVGADALTPFHVPWCLYIATLSCWAYHHTRPSQSLLGQTEGNEHDEIVWDPEGEMNTLVKEMAERSETSFNKKGRTNGLVWTMAEALTKVRWGIVHAGVVVLKGLVPGRLIHQAG